MIEPVNLLHSKLPQSSLQCTGMGIILSVSQFFSCIFIICYTNFLLFESHDHPDFEICFLRNSDLASCVKFSVSKITRYTVVKFQFRLLTTGEYIQPQVSKYIFTCSQACTYLWFEVYMPKYTPGGLLEVSCDHGISQI